MGVFERVFIVSVWLFGIVLALVAALGAVLVLQVHFSAEHRLPCDDPHFAEIYFTDRVSFIPARATRRWHPSGVTGEECTFAIVDLSRPVVDEREDDTELQSRWGGRWQATPADHPGRNNRDALLGCVKDFDEATSRKLAWGVDRDWVVVCSGQRRRKSLHPFGSPGGAAYGRYGD